MKSGYKVVCVNNINNLSELTIGGIYTVISKSLIGSYDSFNINDRSFYMGIKLSNDMGTYNTYRENMFIGLDEYRKNLINDILE